MTRRTRPMSEGAVSLLGKHEITEADDREKFDKFQQLLKNAKNKQRQDQLRRRPFQIGYAIIFVICAIFLLQGFLQMNKKIQQTKTKANKKYQECLIQYSSKKCELSHPTTQCNEYIQCMKNPYISYTWIEFVVGAINIAINEISENILGPLLLALLAFLLKIIQILSNKVKNRQQKGQ